MKSINLKRVAAAQTDTKQKDWVFVDGPDSRVGVDYWLENKKTGDIFYANCDQGEWTFEANCGEDA